MYEEMVILEKHYKLMLSWMLPCEDFMPEHMQQVEGLAILHQNN